MRLAVISFGLALPLLVAACGKMGPLETPAGSTYPKNYPLNAITSVAAPSPAIDGSHPAFTKSGAWIDPDTRRPQIDPRADQDNWSAINRPGTN